MAINMQMTGISVTTEDNKVLIGVGERWGEETWTFTPNQARIIALAINASADELEEVK